MWVDRQGQETPIPAAPPRNYAFPRLSPDGTRIAIYIPDQEIDIWMWDPAHATLTRATFDPGVEVFPVWPPDGRQLLFSSARTGEVNLFAQAADGSGDVTQLTKSPNVQHASSVSPDGTRLVFPETTPTTGLDVMQLRLDGTHAVTPLVQTPFSERNGEVSPDGRWLAYEANDWGDSTSTCGHFRMSRAATGRCQRTAARGRCGRGTVKSCFIRTRRGPSCASAWRMGGPGRRPRRPSCSRDATGPLPAKAAWMYDIAPDGKRFLMIKAGGGADQTSVPTSLVVVQNWREELKRLVPTK